MEILNGRPAFLISHPAGLRGGGDRRGGEGGGTGGGDMGGGGRGKMLGLTVLR